MNPTMMKIEAFAKINLTLQVLGKRVDGYHALRSVVQPISLADLIEVERADDGSIASDTGFPDDLCVKAAKALGVGAKIHVEKHIPTGGGLGGGSADAAAVLRALNSLYNLGHTPEALAEIGATFGSDIPALVLAQHYREPILMEGRGEIVSRLPGTPREAPRHLVLANPGVHSSTPEVFRAFTLSTYPTPLNDLQGPAISLHPEIGTVLHELTRAGAHDAMMSGSGATVFGFASDEPRARQIAEILRARGFHAWSVHTL